MREINSRLITISISYSLAAEDKAPCRHVEFTKFRAVRNGDEKPTSRHLKFSFWTSNLVSVSLD